MMIEQVKLKPHQQELVATYVELKTRQQDHIADKVLLDIRRLCPHEAEFVASVEVARLSLGASSDCTGQSRSEVPLSKQDNYEIPQTGLKEHIVSALAAVLHLFGG